MDGVNFQDFSMPSTKILKIFKFYGISLIITRFVRLILRVLTKRRLGEIKTIVISKN